MLDLRHEYEYQLWDRASARIQQCSVGGYAAVSCWMRFHISVHDQIVTTLSATPAECYGVDDTNKIERLGSTALEDIQTCLIKAVGNVEEMDISQARDSVLASYDGPLDVNLIVVRPSDGSGSASPHGGG